MCGRNPNADYVLNSPKIPEECLNNFSREHFLIEKYIDVDDIHNLTAILYDKSTTGTEKLSLRQLTKINVFYEIPL